MKAREEGKCEVSGIDSLTKALSSFIE